MEHCVRASIDLKCRFTDLGYPVIPIFQFLCSCNRLRSRDFKALQRLMREPIEDVQVNHCFLRPDVVLELPKSQKPSSKQGKCPQLSSPELRQLEDKEAVFLAESCTDSVPILHVPTL